MQRIHVTPCSLAMFVLLAAGGCGDDAAGSADTSAGPSSSTGAANTDPTTTTTDPSTGVDPTSSGSGVTEALTSTSSSTTDPIDPGTSSSTTDLDPSTTGLDTSTTADTSSSTGEVCAEDTIFCDGRVAMVCDGMGGIKSMEECEVCTDGLGCAECALAMPEVCDGLDNDCDDAVDEDGICGAGSCAGGGGPCIELPLPIEQPLVSGCLQPFPPTQGLPCPIANPGAQLHVSATTGDDSNDGLTPETAWATLCHAVDAAPAGSTLRVAEGQYASASVYVGKALTVKGGYDPSFTTWDPDAHPSTFYGRLNLDHNDAVFGGFRIIANPLIGEAWSYAHHFVGAGTLVRNYIEIVATGGDDPDTLNLYGIVASACPGGVTVLRCNDIYVRSSAPQTFVVSAVEYGNHALHAGQAVLDANRICQDGGGSGTDAVGGYGSCFPQTVSLLLRNNIIEKAGFGGGQAINFYNCGAGDMTFTLSNNTILSSGRGIEGSGDPATQMQWKLTNNIVMATAAGPSAVDLGAAGVEIVSSETNLVFGFQSNAILPPPLFTAGDDLSGLATAASVFIDAAGGDLRLAPDGQGIATGLNVYGLPEYGALKYDLAQTPRPQKAPWDRGALEH